MYTLTFSDFGQLLDFDGWVWWVLQQGLTGLVGELSYVNSHHNNVVDDCRAKARMKKTYYIY